ncbi:Uncharacterized protein, contains PIN domain [Mesorhizobium albiziae]|uniref:Ribonuclease VapC n=1 Tax=Neomesorhizobium albiziae TaxID=335020 RepID=A0A1I3WQB5_9HYPH|nr:type II toxin-antitoxin system VapC family toxin [Mesorhizobium albiziae]GLS31790.1 ribonuclease VapC [Mesorhizobium albiziae]SFK09373.1 Uncharacterized protein, contains PIN domain [Mesorhizobium albiziae]
MSGLVVDTSVLIAILALEPEARSFARSIAEADFALVSTATLHETYCVGASERFVDGVNRLEKMVLELQLDKIAFDTAQLETSTAAYMRYGRGSGHAARLNFGDCFAYALAKTRNLPLLFKGDDFIHTDIEPALKPA